MTSKKHEELTKKELEQVNGGLKKDQMCSFGRTHNLFCKKCGYVTPHSLNKFGEYACNWCATPVD